MADIFISKVKIEGTIVVRDKGGNIKAELRLADKTTVLEEVENGTNISNSSSGRHSESD